MEKLDKDFSKLKINDDIAQYTCPICINLLTKPVHTECGHSFCYNCLEELMENSDSESLFRCPMCRATFSKNFSLNCDKKLECSLATKFPIEYKKRLEMLEEYEKEQLNYIKIKILYGNTHQLVENPKKSRTGGEASNKHKWCMFVKTNGEEEKNYIRKVEFGMHPTFGCTEIEVKSAPFEISRIGWGTFDIPVKVFLNKSLKVSKPLELSHCLSFEGSGETKVYILKIPKTSLIQEKKEEVKTQTTQVRSSSLRGVKKI
jgi:transcription initiation factor IIF auxiliary subunit